MLYVVILYDGGGRGGHHIILEIGLVRELQKSSLQTNFMDWFDEFGLWTWGNISNKWMDFLIVLSNMVEVENIGFKSFNAYSYFY